MADEAVAGEARERGITRASVSMEHAARDIQKSGRRTIFAVGNAPTALISLRNMYDEGIFTPDFVIGVPVGFVNVVEAKELILETDIPHIVNSGRKCGSNVAAAIVNALIYGLAK
jgi:precorrin-8X/cobalt-precorrin-8 methylmutase